MRKILGGDVSEDQLEALLDSRRRELEAQAAALETAIGDLEQRESLLRDSRASLERLLRLGTSDLDSRESELAELIRELTAREERLQEAENELTRRRSELGAVELRRASVEQRERALAEKEAELEERDQAPAEDTPSAAPAPEPTVELAFVPGERYRLVEVDGAGLSPGSTFTQDDDDYVVARIGPSPLPGDSRRCAYLVRGPRGRSSGGSS
jgi:chromosome segregation ATPase